MQENQILKVFKELCKSINHEQSKLEDMDSKDILQFKAFK